MAITQITADVIADGTVVAAEIADNAIDSQHYADGSIDEAHIAADAVNFATHLKAGTDGELITWDASGNPAAVAVGTATHVLTSGGAGVAPTFAAAAAGGTSKNYIIDGDFTIWIGATAATALAGDAYGGWWGFKTVESTDGTATHERSTSVPTVAESGHESYYSMLIKCTGTDASIASGQFIRFYYSISSADFAYLHEQECTVSFWCKTAANNSGHVYTVAFHNDASNRSYVHNFTATSSWTKVTHTFTLDTSGTWDTNPDSASWGMRIYFALAVGTTYQGTNDTWEGANDFGTSSTSNFMASTSNEFYISQFMFEKGSSASTFITPPIATVKDQVAYYVERYDFTSSNAEVWQEGGVENTGQMRAMVRYREKRVAPTITSTVAGTFDGWDFSSDVNGNSIAFDAIHTRHARVKLGQAGTSWTVGQNSAISRDGSDTCNVTYDARH